jgi:Domain of unknown function (DUF932)
MLNLHSGGELVEYDALRQLETPPATATHVPVEHHRLVDLVRGTLSMFGHEIVEEHHALDHDAMRYFGLMTLRSPYTGYTDTLGLRNSHDKAFPIGVSFGSQVFVCSNLSFMGDHVIKRRHTANAKRELPGLLMEIIEPLALQREHQAKKFEHYHHAQLTDQQADHAIMQMYRDGIINVQRIADVAREWDEPSFEEFNERNAWRLFNAATFALNGRIAENPAVTARLHQVIDGVCSVVN